MLNFLELIDSLFQQEIPQSVTDALKESKATLERTFTIVNESGTKLTITEEQYREWVLNVSNPYVPVGSQRPVENESALVKEFKEKHEELLKDREQNEYKLVVSLPKGATLEEGSIINKLVRSEKWGSAVQFVSNSPTLSLFTIRRIAVRV